MHRTKRTLRKLYLLAFICFLLNVVYVLHHIWSHTSGLSRNNVKKLEEAGGEYVKPPDEVSHPRETGLTGLKPVKAETVKDLHGKPHESKTREPKVSEGKSEKNKTTTGKKDITLKQNEVAADKDDRKERIGKAQENQRLMMKGMATTDTTKQRRKAPYFNNTRAGELGGPGSMGEGVVITKLSAAEQKRLDHGKHEHAFNEYASSKMSLHRSLPDARFKE